MKWMDQSLESGISADVGRCVFMCDDKHQLVITFLAEINLTICMYVLDISPTRGVYLVYTLSISNLYHIETVNYDSILCKLFCASRKFCANYYFTGAYDSF